mgnify:FL=1
MLKSGNFSLILATSPWVALLSGCPTLPIRSDVDHDNDVDQTDEDLVRGEVGKDARNIADPICP